MTAGTSASGRCSTDSMQLVDPSRWRHEYMTPDERVRMKAYMVDVTGHEPAVDPEFHRPDQARTLMMLLTLAALADIGIGPRDVAAPPTEDIKCRLTLATIRQVVAMEIDQAGPPLRNLKPSSF